MIIRQQEQQQQQLGIRREQQRRQREQRGADAAAAGIKWTPRRNHPFSIRVYVILAYLLHSSFSSVASFSASTLSSLQHRRRTLSVVKPSSGITRTTTTTLLPRGQQQKCQLLLLHQTAPSSSSAADDTQNKSSSQQQQPNNNQNSSSSSSNSFSAEGIATNADILLDLTSKNSPKKSVTSRRILFAGGLMAAGSAVAAISSSLHSSSSSRTKSSSSSSSLPWEITPVNKRTGVTVFDAEKDGYNVRFVTYLSRFLLCFDEDCQRWWYSRAADIPRTATAETVNDMRLAQFGAFSASVEVGLQDYQGPKGPKTLLRSLLSRYCPDVVQARAARFAAGKSPLSHDGEEKMEREVKEARRQIALLFGLMEKNQPVDEITKLLAAIDNGSIASIRLTNPGAGYAPGYGPPDVRFPAPDAGENYQTATGRAVLRPNGKLLRIDLVNRGFGYIKAPTVTIPPPASIRFSESEDDKFGRTAEAKAFLFRSSGVNKGRIERIQLLDPGAGYSAKEIIRIRISPPDLPAQDGGVSATATAVLELEVGEIQIVSNGTGYAVEKPIPITVEPPPLTARVNMNDPLMARIISPNEPLPATTIPSKEMLSKMPGPNDPSSVSAKVMTEAGKAGSCIGRGCYDDPVEAVAFARAEADSYVAFRDEEDALQPQRIENALTKKDGLGGGRNFISASTSGTDGGVEFPSFGAGQSSSSQLLSLLPSGIGLQFNSENGRYQLAIDPSVQDSLQGQLLESSAKAFDPDFGPRGRSPIERQMELSLSTYLRFIVSGAICCSGVHLALTPIDVVKTKVQTDPVKYPSVVKAFQRVLEDEGMQSFFTGWAPTFLGFFVWGGISYALTEFLRRFLAELAGSSAGDFEVSIILAAAGIAAFFGSFTICPFEAVRIRSVAQPNYAPNVGAVFSRMVKEEGIPSLFSAVPAFLLKEIPFAMAKFTVFDLSTAYMYDLFPVAREDLKLSLLVSLAGGTLGGMMAAVVSNPADVTISEMKKAKTDMGPAKGFEIVLDRGGPSELFRGLPLRLVFYSLIVSFQFLIYDAVRIALGIGSDDLTLYLDVLGGALKEGGGPV